MRFCCVFRLLLLMFCVTSSALAQSTDATISGQVIDPAGRVIPDADIQILNEATGIRYSNRTNDSGIYTVSILPPGQYRVQVSKIGFKTIIKPGIVLNVQSAIALNFTLPLGATSESITIEAGSSLINTTDASVGTVIDRKFVENIPLNGRSFQDLISLTPGVVTQSPQTSNQATGYNGDFSVNGQRTESNYYTVDGVSGNTNPGDGNGVYSSASSGALASATVLGTTQSLIPVDALQEFKIQSSSYSAEYGRTPGGQFAMVTRSGGSIFHGSVFEYLRNNFFDANDWFNDHYGEPITALRQNDFGGTLGGPLRLSRSRPNTDKSFFFVSYEGLRLTQPQAASIQYVPDTFMRAQAPPAIQPMLNAFPVPNGMDYGNSANPSLAQFIQSFSNPSQIDSTSVRFDHIFTPKLSAFFRYGDAPSSTDTRVLSAVTAIQAHSHAYTIGMTNQLSDKMTNELRVGYTLSSTSSISHLDQFGNAVPINLSDSMLGANYPSAASDFNITLNGIGPTQLNLNYGVNRGRQWNAVDQFSLLVGRHQFKFGLDYLHVATPTTQPSPLVESEFGSTQSVLTNAPDLTYIFKELDATPTSYDIAAFGQDEWRITQRLNLSLGLRWEIEPPLHGADGNDPYTLLGTLADPPSLTLAPKGTPLWGTTWHNLAPRLGLAWTAIPRAGYETVFRTGGGVFFDTANREASQGFDGIGFSAYNALFGEPLPVTPTQLDFSPSSVTAPYTNSVIYAFPRHLQLPYTLQWNASLEQSMGREQAVTLSYVGANGRRLINYSQNSLSSLNPNFGTVLFFNSGVTSNYQALQMQFQRSVQRGIQAIVSYTWSHSIDFGSNDYVLPVTRGNSDFDVRNNFQAGLSWELPSVADHALTHALLHNWGLDARFLARTGFPVTLGGNYITDPATGSQYYGNVDIVPDQPIYLHGSQYPGGRRINPAAFALPRGNGTGDAPRNFVRGFGETQINLAARREFILHDRLVMQFRAETFNLLNHPNFGLIPSSITNAQFGEAIQMLNHSLGTVSSLYQQGGPRSMQFALRVRF
jgi:hypothetical protein